MITPFRALSFALLTLGGVLSLQAQEGDLYGIIEIGSSGVKPLVIQSDPVKEVKVNAAKWSEDTSAPIEPFKVRAKLPPEDVDALNESAANKVAATVQRAYTAMREQYNVPASQIYVVGSSGLASQPSKAGVETAVNDLLKLKMEFVTAEDEATLEYHGILDRLPPSVRALRYRQVLVIDIGSGNTKGASVQRVKPLKFGTFEVKWGTKGLAKEVDKKRGTTPFLEFAEETKGSVLRPALRDAIQRFPSLQNQERVYLGGGAAWALTVLLHPEAPAGDFVLLRHTDIKKFHDLVTGPPEAIFNVDLSKVKPEQREAAQRDLDRVKNETFNANQLAAAGKLLLALDEEIGLRKKTVFFARSALYAWPMGYVAQKITPTAN